MVAEARAASERIAAEEGCTVEWAPQFVQAPVAFHPDLVEIGAEALRELTGQAPRLPSGPLHDAAEMARRVPAVMLFVRSIGGVSHTKEEDSAVEDIELSVRALHELTVRTLAWAERGGA
jgi:N-carbamoyl-L-amino-acid hydrolase